MKVSSVTESAVQYLRDRIITGQFKPDEKLNEQKISDEIEISRPPLREAFRILEHEKLIQSIPRKGAHVTGMSAEIFEKLYDVREMIELYALDIIEKNQISRLHQAETALLELSSVSLLSDFNGLDEKYRVFKLQAMFHVKVVEDVENEYLTNCYQSISSNIARYQFIYFSLPEIRQGDIEEHHQFIELVKKEKYTQAKTFLFKHIRGYRDWVLEKLK